MTIGSDRGEKVVSVRQIGARDLAVLISDTRFDDNKYVRSFSVWYFFFFLGAWTACNDRQSFLFCSSPFINNSRENFICVSRQSLPEVV